MMQSKKIHIILILLLMLPAFTIMAGGKGSNAYRNVEKTKKYIICLDAGHGGKDAGAVGSTSSNREKDINLAIILELKRLLNTNCSDVKTICTRETDVFIELGRRAEIANKAKANLFVSVHVNAIPRSSRKARGVQSYTLAARGASTNLDVEKRENSVISYENGKYNEKYSNPRSSESDIMYELMQQKDLEESVKFAKMAQSEMVHYAGRKDMGVQQANLAVLRLTYMPSVLLEVGYISTEEEESFLMTTAGRNKMARAIYNAIVQYKSKVTGRASTLMPPDATTTYSDDETVSIENDVKETTVPVTPPASTTTKQTTTSATTGSTTAGSTKQTATQTTTKGKGTTNTTTTGKQTNSTSKQTTANNANAPVFKVQIGSSSLDLSETDKQFKGYKVEKYKDGTKYKYFTGASTDYNEVKQTKATLKSVFPGCYIVAFKNGQIVDVNAAIDEYNKTK